MSSSPNYSKQDILCRVMSRKPRPEDIAAGLEWAQADVLTGEGLKESVTDVDVVIHGA